jgi:uroporphyrinogen-III synthase
MNLKPRIKRLGLAREPGNALCEGITRAEWLPVSFYVTAMKATGIPAPIARPDAVILLSPNGAQQAILPEGVPLLATGEGTARIMVDREVWTPEEPSAEGLWMLLKVHFPKGGDFLLVRGERSRGHLEAVAEGTPWRMHPWISHTECPLEPLPDLPELEAVLALSPQQAELLGPLAAKLLRFAWGHRAARAFESSGFPAIDVCEPKLEALERMLRAH